MCRAVAAVLTRQLTPEAKKGGISLHHTSLFKCITRFIFSLSFLLLIGTGAEAAALQYGDSGPEVATLQRELQKLHYSVAVDGQFGSMTLNAVKEFQASRGLYADGVAGTQTLSELRLDVPQTSRAVNPRSLIDRIIATGKQYMGVPYVFGGESPSGFDCSGFVQYVFGRNGLNLPRTADVQFERGYSVSQANLIPGDLVFFSTYLPGASHDGIYLGNGQFIHASSSRGVTVDRLASSYWSQRYVGARRIIS